MLRTAAGGRPRAADDGDMTSLPRGQAPFRPRPLRSLTLRSDGASPYAIFSAVTGAEPAPRSKRQLLGQSRLLESAALRQGAGALVLATLQEAHQLSPATLDGYRRIAGAGATVLLFAHGFPPARQLADRLWTIDLAADDSVRDEWNVLVCSPSERFGFAAEDVHEHTATELERSFRWISCRAAGAVGRAANALLDRVPTLGLRVPLLTPPA